MNSAMEYQNVNRVLQNHVVLQQIFPHLNLSELKSCRLMCKKWEEVSRQDFIKKAVCCIRNTESVTRDLQLFEQNFCDATTELPLVKFKRLRFEGEFSESDLQIFFADRPFIKELTLNTFSLTDSAGKHKRFDISKWSGLSLTALTIKNNYKGFVVPLNYIGDIKKLKLNFVTIMLNGRVSPQYLSLSDVALDFGDGELNSEDVLIINDYFEVKNLKKAKLFDDLYLDLTHCCQLEHLSLDGKAKVVGLHKELILKRLDIYHKDVGINLSDLPPSVKQLNVTCPLRPNTNVQCHPTDTFPNVKSLGLFQNCKLFTQCRNLIRLEVDFIFVADLRTLPRSLKVIKCNKGKFMVSGNHEHSDGIELEKLIYENDLSFNWEDMPENITSLKPKIVVFNCLPVTSYMANVCGVCHCLVDHVFPVVQQQIQRGGTFILGGVSTAGRTFCQCFGPTSLFHEKADYIKCSPDSKGKMNATSISKKDFDAYVNDY